MSEAADAPHGDAPAFAGAVALGRAFRDGRLSPVEAARSALAGIDRLDPVLNAFIEPMRDAALAAAETAGRELADGLDRGPLHGVPVAIKDLIDVAGVPTGFATRAVPPRLAQADAVLVARLRGAGAVILGKTNLLEFAYGIAHPAVGQTNNPHDPGRTSGGSSGGSAAAVAAGIVPLAVGTDTGGSIRIPASYCGVVGLKPSFGLVPTQGVFPLSPSLDHAGPLARSVADAAALLGVLANRAMLVEARDPGELRIGVIAAHRRSPLVSAGVRDAFKRALAALEAAGARIADVAIGGLDGANEALGNILLPEAARVHRALEGADPAGYAPGTLAQIEAGASVSALDHLLARERAIRLRAEVERLFTRFDVLASPSVAFVAPAEDPEIGGPEGEGEMLSSGFANLTGHPAISLPCGLSEGLPVGIQLVGALGRDAALLGAAASVEGVLAFSALPRIRMQFGEAGDVA